MLAIDATGYWLGQRRPSASGGWGWLGSEVVALLYRSIWLGALLLACSLGFAGGVLSLPPSGLVVIAIVGALAGWALAAWIRHDRGRLRRTATVVIGCAFTAVAFCGGVATLGFLPAVGIGLVLAVLSPKTVRWLLRHLCPPADPPDALPRIERLPVEEMRDADLCLAWRQSYVTMNNCTNAARQARVAAQRQTYLDELERRHPAEFTCWLYGEASPANDPGHYLDLAD